MLAEYTIQPFTLDSYPLMKELFRSAFNKELDHAAFLKKYDTRSLGHDVIGFIAIHETTGCAAAFYGVFPVTVILDGEKHLAAQSGDTMTHEHHRRKGLFVHLARLTIEQCKKEQVRFVFGQPNENSMHGFIHNLKFVHMDAIVRYDLKLTTKTFPLPKLMAAGNKSGLFMRYAKKVLKRHIISGIEDFTNKSNCSLARIYRNNAYLNYKEGSNKFFIRIHKAVFWISLDDVIRIGDIQDYEQVDTSVLRALKRLAFLLGYNTISFYCNKSMEQPAFLEKFSPAGHEPSCFYYTDDSFTGQNLLITCVDFDTW